MVTGEKVIYVDGSTGNEYEAEVCGPLANIQKGYVDENGKEVKGTADIVPGKCEITNDRKEKLTVEYIDVRVNFARKGLQPRWGLIRGVRLEKHLMGRYKKDYYKPIAAPEAPKGKAPEAPKGK